MEEDMPDKITQERINAWVKQAEQGATAVEGLIKLTQEMQNDFVTVFDEAKDDFESTLQQKDKEIETLREDLRVAEDCSNRENLLRTLQEILDYRRGNPDLEKILTRLVEYVETRPTEPLTRDQILSAAQAW